MIFLFPRWDMLIPWWVTLETPIEFRRLKEPAPAAFRTALMEGFRKEVHSFNPEVHQGAVEKNFNFGGGGNWNFYRNPGG